jgi:hypothetical protein
MTMSASASSLDGVNARRQRMWASGDNAVYQADGSGCPRSTVTAPDGRSSRTAATSTWPPNEGSSPVELNAIFLACTGTKEFLAPVTQPKGCQV